MSEAPRDAEGQTLECADCWRERYRRARALDLAGTGAAESTKLMNSAAFANSVYITTFNKSVFFYASMRARNFAQTAQQQLFWIHATDTPPSWFASGLSKTDLQQLQRKWLQYHSKKTEGVLSLLPLCFNMPLKVTHSHGKDFKKYGIHNGASCVLKAWDLEPEDAQALEDETRGEVILKHLPTKLYGRTQT